MTIHKILIGAACAATAIGIAALALHRPTSAHPGIARDKARPAVAANGQGPAAGSATRPGNPFQVPRLSADERNLLAADPAAALAAHPGNLDLLVAWAAMDPTAALAWADAQKSPLNPRAGLLGAIAAGVLLSGGRAAMDEFLGRHLQDPGLPPKYRSHEELLTHAMAFLGRDDSLDEAMTLLAAVRDKPEGNDAPVARECAGKLASAMVLGTKGDAADKARAIDYLEAKGIPVAMDYWHFQTAIDADPRYWADWAWKRDSGLLAEIVQAWNREHPAEAGAWVKDRIPADDPRREEIEELITP